jgi:hypothetical protein
MTQDDQNLPAPDRPGNERAERRVLDRPDRRAHDRYTPDTTPPSRSDRRQTERRRSDD